MTKIIMFFLGRGIKAGYKLDPQIFKALNSLNEKFVVKIQILGSGSALAFYREGEKIVVLHSKKAKAVKADLDIVFKNLASAKNVLFGKVSIAMAFAMHYFLVYGEIYVAMDIVRVLERVENYLFPKFITKKLFPVTIKKQVSSFRYYLKVLFGV